MTPIIILAVSFVGILVMLVYVPIRMKRKINNYNSEEIQPLEVQTVQEIRAKVISKDVHIRHYGYKLPTHSLIYSVVFETENNEIKEYEVTSEIFDRCDPHAVGSLITVDGEFYDFAKNENV